MATTTDDSTANVSTHDEIRPDAVPESTTATTTTENYYNGKTIRPQDWPWVWSIQEPEPLNWRVHLRNQLQGEEYELKVKQVEKKQTHFPVELMDGLYISDAFTVAVETKRFRDEVGITHVLNMGGYDAQFFSRRQAHYENLGIIYKMVDAVDTDDYPLLWYHWDECKTFLDQAFESNPNAKVVVHCAAGVNRSGLIATAYCMIKQRYNVLETVYHCRKCRGTLLTNQSFQRQLVALAREEGLLGPAPGSKECTLVQTSPPSLEEAIQREKSKRTFRGW